MNTQHAHDQRLDASVVIKIDTKNVFNTQRIVSRLQPPLTRVHMSKVLQFHIAQRFRNSQHPQLDLLSRDKVK